MLRATRNPLDGVMSVQEAAGALGVSRRRVRQLCQRGDLQARRRGRDWAIAARSVRKYRPRPVGRPAAQGPK